MFVLLALPAALAVPTDRPEPSALSQETPPPLPSVVAAERRYRVAHRFATFGVWMGAGAATLVEIGAVSVLHPCPPHAHECAGIYAIGGIGMAIFAAPSLVAGSLGTHHALVALGRPAPKLFSMTTLGALGVSAGSIVLLDTAFGPREACNPTWTCMTAAHALTVAEVSGIFDYALVWHTHGAGAVSVLPMTTLDPEGAPLSGLVIGAQW